MRRTSLAGSRRPLEGDDLEKVEVVRLAQCRPGVLFRVRPELDFEVGQHRSDLVRRQAGHGGIGGRAVVIAEKHRREPVAGPERGHDPIPQGVERGGLQER